MYAVYSRTFTFVSGVGATITDATKTQYYNSSGTVSTVTIDSTPSAISGWTALKYRNDTSTGNEEWTTSITPSATATYSKMYAAYKRTFSATFYYGPAKRYLITQTSDEVYYNSNTASVPTSTNVTSPAVPEFSEDWTALGWRADTSDSAATYASGATVTAGTKGGTATITVTSAATQNYAEQTATYTVKVENGEIKTVAKGEFKNALDENVQYFDSAAKAKVKVVGEKCVVASMSGSVSTIAGIDDANVYIKVNDKYTLVAKGTKYDSNEEYYNVTTKTDGTVGSVNTVSPHTVPYVKVDTAGKVWDEKGNKIAVGELIKKTDFESKYYMNVAEVKLDQGDAITDFSKYTENAVSQFVDKDGNEIAENGLYRYLDQEGNLTGELYFKSGKAVTQKDVNDYVKSDKDFARGALSLKLHVGADATDNNQIQVDIQAMDSERLGIKNVDVSGATDEGALNAIETIKEAVQMISTQRSALGAVQNRLEHTIANLDNVVENTTSAESQIRDTDMATEMVKYSNNNILAQAGQAMLAQANQANQGVLSILG